MHGIAREPVKQDIFAVTVAQATHLSASLPFAILVLRRTHPSTKPTMDMTANVRLYDNLAVNHAEGSGQALRNHSRNTVGW